MSQLKTSADQDATIYRLLNVPAITGILSGGVYRTVRPANSTKEDIVIQSLTLGDGTAQFGMVNVNIHVPDLLSNAKNPPVYLPDSKRMADICSVMLDILDDVDTDEATLWINSTKTVSEPEIQQHFLNVRVETRFYNLS